MSRRTISGLPVRAAVIRIVLPPGSFALASAPAFSSASAMAAFRLVAASESGVTP